MHPILFEIQLADRAIAIHAYPVALAAAIATAWAGGYRGAVRAGLPGRKVAIALTIALAGVLLGARLMHGLLHPDIYVADPSLLWRPQLGAFAMHGVLVGGLLGGWGACRVLSLSAARFADAATVPALLALGFVRLGCWLNGCCFGTVTLLSWGATFPAGSLPHVCQLLTTPGLPLQQPRAVHPTQIYEIAAAILSVAVAAYLRCRPALHPPVAGKIFLLAFAAYLSCLAGITGLRGDLSLAGVNIWILQSMNGILLLTIGAVLVRSTEPGSGSSDSADGSRMTSQIHTPA